MWFALAVQTVLLLVLLLRGRSGLRPEDVQAAAQVQQAVLAGVQAQGERLDRLERELRRELAEAARASRQEIGRASCRERVCHNV